MRKTTLNRTTLTVTGVLLVVAIALGIVRNTLVSHPENAEALDERAGQSVQLSQPASLGEKLFIGKGCAQCHVVDSTDRRMAPGLKGMFQKKTLPVSGRLVTVENVDHQLKAPYKNMPSFADRLTDKERDQIIAYLKTL